MITTIPSHAIGLKIGGAEFILAARGTAALAQALEACLIGQPLDLEEVQQVRIVRVRMNRPATYPGCLEGFRHLWHKGEKCERCLIKFDEFRRQHARWCLTKNKP